jgi:hypothetical protein
MMARTLPTELHRHRVRLTREPTTPAEARAQVRAFIRAWEVPVDPDIAALLASDLVTDAITDGSEETITLAVSCFRGHLRIDVYDTSRSLPMAAGEPTVPETRCGLVLVAALSADWGLSRTRTGQAAYFTLAFQQSCPGCAVKEDTYQ